MAKIFDSTAAALSKSMDMRLQKHNLISGNIANAETPGYKAKKLDFEDRLARAVGLGRMGGLETSDPQHIESAGSRIQNVKADIYDNPEGNLTNDKNTVDLEREMAALAENSILYKTTIELIRKKLGAMNYAITEGSGR